MVIENWEESRWLVTDRANHGSTALPLLAAAVEESQQHPGRAGDTLGFRLFYYLWHMYRHLRELK